MTTHENGTWGYEEEGVLEIPGRAEPFHHLDRNTLSAPPNLWLGRMDPRAGTASSGLRSTDRTATEAGTTDLTESAVAPDNRGPAGLLLTKKSGL